MLRTAHQVIDGRACRTQQFRDPLDRLRRPLPRQVDQLHGGTRRRLQRCAAQRRRSTEGVLGQHRRQPVDRRGVRGDQAVGELLNVGALGRDRERLDVARTVEELILQRQVTQQCLVERLRLLGQRLHRRGGTAQERTDGVGETAEIADRLFDRLGADAAVVRVLCQLFSYCFGASLRHAGLGDLNLRVGQVEHGPQLCEQCGFGGSHQ